MKKTSLPLVLAFALIFGSTICLFAQQTPPPEVQQAAENGLQPFLEKMPAGDESEYGFEADDDLSQATLGKPFQLHTIKPEALAGYKAGASVKSVITPLTVWYFPIQINGQTRAILAVDKMEGQWQAVSLGFAPLAKELNAFCRQWSAGQGYNPVLIAVFQAREYLVTVPEKSAFNLSRLNALSETEDAPVVKGVALTPNPYGNLGNADAILGELAPAVLKALQAND